MCCCEKPNINGQPGFQWQPNDPPRIRPVMPPDLDDGDELLYDEPGRCGGTDCHSHHFRVVKRHRRGLALYVRHGGGDVRIELHGPIAGPRTTGSLAETLAALDTNSRYWLLHAIYCAHSDADRAAATKCNERWRRAAAEKRIKTRKQPSKGTVKVWIEPPTTQQS
jgi:hypothetical protein